MTIAQKSIYIGTSGWHYSHWLGPFYPDKHPKDKMLAYYSEKLQTVEINNSFYRLPSERSFTTWRNDTPPDFIFAVKASRFITHMKKLKTGSGALSNMLERIRTLGGKLGPVLFQLPPRWRVNPDRLSDFLKQLPSDLLTAIEFRDPSWHIPRIYDLLSENGIAFCIYDFAGMQSPRMVTADHVYIRLHGPEATAYSGQYDDATLSGWARTIADWHHAGRTVFCYFDNDQNGYASQDALRLRALIDAVR